MDVTWDSSNRYTPNNIQDYKDPANWIPGSVIYTYYAPAPGGFWMTDAPYVYTGQQPGSSKAEWAGPAVRVTWSPAEYADGYVLLRRTKMSPARPAVIVGRVASASVTSFLVTDVAPRGEKWNYMVCPAKHGVASLVSCQLAEPTIIWEVPYFYDVAQGSTKTAQITVGPGLAYVFTKSDGPDWVTVSADGLITAAPTLATPPGQYLISLISQVPSQVGTQDSSGYSTWTLTVTEPVVATSPKDGVVPTKGGSVSLQVKARDTTWSMSGQPSWVHPSVTTGPQGISTVTLTVDPATTNDPRQATLTITSGTTSTTYVLHQDGASSSGGPSSGPSTSPSPSSPSPSPSPTPSNQTPSAKTPTPSSSTPPTQTPSSSPVPPTTLPRPTSPPTASA